MTGAELVSAVAAHFDVDRSTALGYLDQAHRRMVAVSRWRKAEIEVGPTVAGQGVYPVQSNVVDLEGVLYTSASDPTQSAVYDRKGERDIWRLKTGQTRLVGTGGVFAPFFSAGSLAEVQLWPVPTVTGDTLTALAALLPDPMTDSATGPIVPDDFHDGLRDGAISTGMRLNEEDIAAADSYEQRFQAAIEGVRRRLNSRIGSGAQQVQVAGYHF